MSRNARVLVVSRVTLARVTRDTAGLIFFITKQI